jgi:4-alpha-glucanotransferase
MFEAAGASGVILKETNGIVGISNTAVYTGTHDNPTTRGWFEDWRQKLWNYLKGRGGESGEAAGAFMELTWSSEAVLAMAPLQDLLNLGSEARVNVPGRPDGNWRWRFSGDMLSNSAFEWLRDLTKNANRSTVLMNLNTNRWEAASRNGTRLP